MQADDVRVFQDIFQAQIGNAQRGLFRPGQSCPGVIDDFCAESPGKLGRYLSRISHADQPMGLAVHLIGFQAVLPFWPFALFGGIIQDSQLAIQI
ncbi:hypothetical protein DCMF_20120 [Candidatus Formimonas warabiya]|uniref:Uncharacterized protein n=1 Tax=Formimonas warabiya TaxID=1761012 RepID=A0A3G1KW45_FORW1|nr:hypothetical protein DCMF_20120 [Candidatus Formimonas warabiya]